MKITTRGVSGVTLLDIHGRITNNPASREVRRRIEKLLELGKQRLLVNLAGDYRLLLGLSPFRWLLRLSLQREGLET